MPSKATRIAAKPLTGDAETRIKEYSEEYSVALLTEAKTLAYYRRDDVVLPNHVNEAHLVIRAARQPRAWWKPWLNFAAGIFGGASIPGIIGELQKQPEPMTEYLVAWIVLGFVGVLMFAVSHQE